MRAASGCAARKFSASELANKDMDGSLQTTRWVSRQAALNQVDSWDSIVSPACEEKNKEASPDVPGFHRCGSSLVVKKSRLFYGCPKLLEP
jgi:hypothetical protein